MVNELNYLYSNKNIPETQLQRQIRRAMEQKERLYEKREDALETAIIAQNKNRLSNMSIGDMSFKEVTLLDQIMKADREGDNYFDDHPGEKRRNGVDEDGSLNDASKELTRFREAVEDIGGLLDKINRSPKMREFPGVAEKIGKCNEIMTMLYAMGKDGNFSRNAIKKAFKGYQKPKPCLLKKSIKKPRRSDNNEYAVLGGSQYTRAELIEARNELNGILNKIDNF